MNNRIKYIITFVVLFFSFYLYSQDTKTQKPKRVIVANDEIISMEQLETYEKSGYIKAIEVSPNETEKERLKKKLGDDIGDFVVIISLFTEEEKLVRENKKNDIQTEDGHNNLDVNNSYKPATGDKALDFTVEMISGEKIKLSDLRGKVVMLNFWATWCSPCLMEFHEIPAKILQPFEDKNFVFLPIARGETKEKVAKKMIDLKNKDIDFNTGVDPNQEIWDLYATDMIPKNFIIDQKGIVRFISTGYREESVDEIAKEISKLLNEQ